MTKIKKKSKTQIKESALNNFSLDKYIPEKYQTIFLFAVILLIFLIYYAPMYFGGKTFQSGDIVTSHSLKPFTERDSGGYTLWFPYIFGGMPAYVLATGFKWFNLIWVALYALRSLFTLFFSVEYSRWTFYLLILAFSSYSLIHYLTKNRLVSLFGALSTSFSTGIVLFLMIGHVTKLTALCFYPLIFLLLLRMQSKVSLRDFLLLIITIHLSFQGWHVQIIYYSILSVGLYYLYYILRYSFKKENDNRLQMIKSLGTYAGAFVIALLIQADNLTQVYQWNPYSTRGTKSIVDLNRGENEKSDADFYEYATNWSFSPGEVLTFIVPSYYGFGKSTYKGPLSQNRSVEVNTYFGQMPFVDVAMYMGVIIFFLGIFSMWANRKNPFVQFLTILVFLSILVSFGRTFPLFYDLLFYYLPFFDKFRVPSMILVLAQLSFPILAALGLKKILDLKNEVDINLEKIIKYGAAAFSVVLVIALILNGTFSSWFESRVRDYAASLAGNRQQMAQQFNALSSYMAGMFIGDLQIASGLLALSFWMAYAYIKSKLSGELLVIAMIVFVMMDLVRIDNRGAEYSKETNIDGLFIEPDYISYIKSRKDQQPFRIFNLKQNKSMGSFSHNSNFNAYFLMHDFYGYSSVKPRAYQDYFDVVGYVNPTMWRMLNTRYIITDKPFNQPGLKLLKQTEKSIIYENTNALPRVYFVDSVASDTPINILNNVKTNLFDPQKLAYADLNDIKIDKPDSTAFCKIIKYEDENIEIDALASGNNFMFFGDTYFPAGWKAYIDGSETKIFRTDHGFRGIVVPKGKHQIVFNYMPVSFAISKFAALILSSLTILSLIIMLLKKRKIKSE